MQPLQVTEPYDTMACSLFPYDDIAAHMSARIQYYRTNARTILDIACGTGNLSLPLAQLGYYVTGLDLSPERIAVARRKAAAANLEISFVCQDMRQAYTGGPVDAITCFFCGLNYLLSPKAVRETFEASYAALMPGGVFVFDQFGNAAMHKEFSGVKAADFGYFYVVTRSKCDAAGRIIHQVTYFMQEADGRYRREENLEQMHIHPFPELAQSLTDTGFTLLAVESFYPQVNAKTLQDIFLFVAQKPPTT